MRVLVTGHDGYVGTLLVSMLQLAGHDATGVDTFFFSDCGVPPGENRPPSGILKGDIRDLGSLDLQGFDAVVHLAALSNDPLGSLNPALTDQINHAASVRLAALCKSAGVERFLFASSCSLYGAGGTSLVGEDAPLAPLTPYGVSKVRVEEELLQMAGDNFSPTFLRAATAYGFSPKLRGDVVVNNLVGSALTRGEVRLLSNGLSWRPLLHIEDMCQAFLAALEAPRALVHGQAFNVVAEGENYQIRDVAEIVAEAVQGCGVTFAEGSGPDPRSYRVDGSKIVSTLPAFRPRWTVQKGVDELLSALSSLELSESDFFGPRFIRLDRLKALLEAGALDSDLRWVRQLATHEDQSGFSDGPVDSMTTS